MTISVKHGDESRYKSSNSTWGCHVSPAFQPKYWQIAIKRGNLSGVVMSQSSGSVRVDRKKGKKKCSSSTRRSTFLQPRGEKGTRGSSELTQSHLEGVISRGSQERYPLNTHQCHLSDWPSKLPPEIVARDCLAPPGVGPRGTARSTATQSV